MGIDEAKGKTKKATGELTGDDDLKREGQADKATDKVKKAADKAKDVISGKDKRS